MTRFIIKHKQDTRFLPRQFRNAPTVEQTVKKEEQPTEAKKEKKEIKESQKVMTTQEKVELANEVLGKTPQVKRVKRDKGLIERSESSKTILTEDNKELLKD